MTLLGNINGFQGSGLTYLTYFREYFEAVDGDWITRPSAFVRAPSPSKTYVERPP